MPFPSTPPIDPSVPECVDCGLCCFTTLPTAIRVTGDDHTRMGEFAEGFTVFHGNRCYLRVDEPRGHCAALKVDPTGSRFACGIYPVRPDVCRDLARGGAACAAERHEKSGRLDRLWEIAGQGRVSLAYTARMDSNLSGTPVRIVAGGATDIGRGRKHNEDAVLMRPDLNAFILADGAGGHNAGNVASALATTSIANHLESTMVRDPERAFADSFGLPADARRLAVAIQHANHDIIEIAATSNKRKGMGTTVVVALLAPEHGTIHLAHVGDSRCYRLRDGHLELLTVDHSLLNDVLELRPDIDDASLARLPGNVVTRALGMEEPIRVSVRTHSLSSGDRYVLCSDGLTDMLGASEIAEILRLPKPPDELVALLIAQANAAGGADNIAAVVIACETASTGPALRRYETFDRPRVKRRAAVPSTAAEEQTPEAENLLSGPEIVLMTNDPEPELEWDSPIRVVPAESASEGMIDALEDFAAPKPARAAARAAAAAHKPVFCQGCGALMDSEAEACEGCGAARTK